MSSGESNAKLFQFHLIDKEVFSDRPAFILMAQSVLHISVYMVIKGRNSEFLA